MKKYLILLGLFLSPFVYAEDPIYTGIFSNKALDGYDTVAYFIDHKPVKGNSQFVIQYKGADWYFSSAEHLKLFSSNPEQYAPQYGGYCAWAVGAKNDFASADPTQWAIVNDKLYLNYDADVKADWDLDRAKFIRDADKNWPSLIKP